MASEADPLRRLAPLVNALEERGLHPVLVGGMALVVRGSQRVTRDFDFLISCRELDPVVVMELYRLGYELITKLGPTGEALRTLDRPKEAAARLSLEKPRSVFFVGRKSGLRVDLLLDFPLPARDIAGRADRVGRKPDVLRVASPEDLLRLKEIAYADRKSAGDAQDIELLRKLLAAGA